MAGYISPSGRLAARAEFLNQVSLDFGIAHADQHYHVPLLVSPWSYSIYWGVLSPEGMRASAIYLIAALRFWVRLQYLFDLQGRR